jgi:hypothetical protein
MIKSLTLPKIGKVLGVKKPKSQVVAAPKGLKKPPRAKKGGLKSGRYN